jgi:hypothetical protein
VKANLALTIGMWEAKKAGVRHAVDSVDVDERIIQTDEAGNKYLIIRNAIEASDAVHWL